MFGVDNRWAVAIASALLPAAFGVFGLGGCVTAPPQGAGSLRPPVVEREYGFLYAEGYASGARSPDEARFAAERSAREQAATSLRAEIRAELRIQDDQMTRRYEQRALTQVDALEFVAEKHGRYQDDIGRSLYESYVVLRMPLPEDRWRRTLRDLDRMERETRDGSLQARMDFLRVGLAELEVMYGVVSVEGGTDNVRLESALNDELRRLPEILVPTLDPQSLHGGQPLPAGLTLRWPGNGPVPRNEPMHVTVSDHAGLPVGQASGETDAQGTYLFPLARVPVTQSLRITLTFSRYPRLSPLHVHVPVASPRVRIAGSVAPPFVDRVVEELRLRCDDAGMVIVRDGEVDLSIDLATGDPEIEAGGELIVAYSHAEMRIHDGRTSVNREARVRAVGVSADGALKALPAAAAAQLYDLLMEALRYGSE